MLRWSAETIQVNERGELDKQSWEQGTVVWNEWLLLSFSLHQEKHGHAGSSLQCQRWCCVSRLCQDQADAATSCSSLVVGQPHVLVHYNSTSLSDMFVTLSSQLLAGFRLFVWIWAPVPEGGGGAWSLRCGSDRWSPDMALTVRVALRHSSNIDLWN